MDPSLILASTSRYRHAVLSRLGLPFTAVAPHCDESSFPTEAPDALAQTLAVAKALSLAAEFPNALILGSDQVVALGDQILGKPGSEAAAVDQLMTMSGRSHRLITAIALHNAATGETRTATDCTVLTMRELTRPQAAHYVAVDQPLDCAGSYKIERLGVALFSHIAADPDTADPTAIEGLPLMKTLALLRAMGLEPLAGRASAP